MAKVTLEQENSEIHIAVKNLIAISGTRLSKVCEKHGLDYGSTIKKLAAKKIDQEFLIDFVKMINLKAELTICVDISISLLVNGEEIFNQKTEK